MTPLRRHASSSGSDDLLALEVFDEDVVVGLGRGREELVAPLGDLIGQLLGDGDLRLLRAIPLVRLAVDQVDVAAERLGCPDGDLQRRDLVAEGSAQRIERGGRVGVLPVGLVDEEAGSPPARAAQTDSLLEPGLDARRRVHHEQSAVDGGEAFDHVGYEVGVPGGVDQ